MTDNRGYSDLRCHGIPVLKTPHLDTLHAESVWFTDTSPMRKDGRNLPSRIGRSETAEYNG
ncbi:MAG: hypothetical protein MI807_21175 [Verrucomicrobiales bacterium]|nr:hypothetical protein [Verrucomicrobiales bacterium]